MANFSSWHKIVVKIYLHFFALRLCARIDQRARQGAVQTPNDPNLMENILETGLSSPTLGSVVDKNGVWPNLRHARYMRH